MYILQSTLRHESTDILLLGKVMQNIRFWREVRLSRGESQQIAWMKDTGTHKDLRDETRNM